MKRSVQLSLRVADGLPCPPPRSTSKNRNRITKGHLIARAAVAAGKVAGVFLTEDGGYALDLRRIVHHMPRAERRYR